MKHLKLTLALLCTILSTTLSFSQDLTKLEEKRGFNDFTLGDSYSKWNSNLHYTNTADDNIKYYDYTGSSCSKAFNYDIEKIRLGFKNDELQVIYLITYSHRDSGLLSEQYKNLKSSLISLYGTPNESAPNSKSKNVIAAWLSKTVVLSLEYQYLGKKKDGDDTYTASKCHILVGVKKDL
jgi:hypothetical protein